MPSPRPPQQKPSPLLEWVLILAALLVVYFPALNGTLLWDDLGHITRPDLQPIAGLWRIWTEIGGTQQYYPVLHSAFWLEHRMWGDSVVGYHLANIVLHSLSAVLLIRILRRLSVPGALLAGLVFALHPVMVESVAWISEQKNTLSGVFYLASAFCYLTFDETRRPSKYILASALFAFALLSKTVTATLPAVLLVIIWWRRGRLEWKRDVYPLLPWLAVGVVGGLVTAWFEQHVIGAQGADFELSFIGRCVLAGRVGWFYVSKLVWPANLTFIYPHWTIDPHALAQYAYLLSAVAVGAAFVVLAKRNRTPLAGFLFFACTLAPVLGFLNVYPFRFSYVADHFQYLASLGVLVPLVGGATVLAQRRQRKHAGSIAAVALLMALGVLTWRQAAIYRDPETLWRTTIAQNPESWIAHLNLGSELAAQKRLSEAVDAFAIAVKLKPDSEQARQDLATAHTMLGASLSASRATASEAAEHLAAAIRLDPNNERTHLNLGNLLLAMPGRTNDAVAEYEAALRVKPDYFRAHYNLGTVLMEISGREDEAIGHLETAVRIEPQSAEAHLNLAVALADTPRTVPEAIKHLEIALSLQPNLTQARDLLSELRRQ